MTFGTKPITSIWEEIFPTDVAVCCRVSQVTQAAGFISRRFPLGSGSPQEISGERKNKTKTTRTSEGHFIPEAMPD